MNRRKFLELFGGLLVAVLFAKWVMPEQSPEPLKLDQTNTDEYIVYFNTTTDGEIKFWHDTEAITRVVYPIDPETAEGFSRYRSTLRVWAE